MVIRKRSDLITSEETDSEMFGILAEDYSHPHEEKPKAAKVSSIKPLPSIRKKPAVRIPLVKIDPASFYLQKDLDVDKETMLSVSPKVLELLQNRVNATTKSLSRLLMSTSIPSMIAVENAVAYTQSVVLDVFGHETEPDQAVPEILGHLSRLDIALFFVAKMRASEDQKALVSSELIKQHTLMLMDAVKSSEKRKNFSSNVDRLKSVIASRKKESFQEQIHPDAELDALDAEPSSIRTKSNLASKLGAKRSRK